MKDTVLAKASQTPANGVVDAAVPCGDDVDGSWSVNPTLVVVNESRAVVRASPLVSAVAVPDEVIGTDASV